MHVRVEWARAREGNVLVVQAGHILIPDVRFAGEHGDYEDFGGDGGGGSFD